MNDLKTAAQQALEAMRCGVPTGKITLADWSKALSDLVAALAQEQAEPVKEPVAVIRTVVGPGDDGVRIKWLRGFPQIGDRLYTAPPKAEPLTEEEAAKACGASGNLGPLMQIVRAVERAHGIGDSNG